MKPTTTTVALAALLASGWSEAANLVVSATGAEELDRVVLSDSSGTALADGGLVEVVHFDGLSDPDIVAAVAGGTVAESGVAFGEQAAVGDGSTPVAGTLEFLARAAISEDSGVLHLLAWNSSSREQATEVLVLRLPGRVPADDEIGLPGYHAVHLAEASLVFGSETPTGFATASISGPSGFEAWITGELVDKRPPEDFAPGADPDGDGAENLLEYALGSRAGDGSSLPHLWIDWRNQQAFVRYLRRIDDSDLIYQAEASASLGEPAGWSIVTAPEEPTVLPPEPAPPAYEWRERTLPSTPGRLFVRLRVE